jgi:hypothetical protein
MRAKTSSCEAPQRGGVPGDWSTAARRVGLSTCGVAVRQLSRASFLSSFILEFHFSPLHLAPIDLQSSTTGPAQLANAIIYPHGITVLGSEHRIDV